MKHTSLITDNHFGKAESNLKSHRSEEREVHTEMEASQNFLGSRAITEPEETAKLFRWRR